MSNCSGVRSGTTGGASAAAPGAPAAGDPAAGAVWAVLVAGAGAFDPLDRKKYNPITTTIAMTAIGISLAKGLEPPALELLGFADMVGTSRQ